MNLTVTQPATRSTRAWLEAAATWRFLSLLFQSPTREAYSELEKLAGELPPEQGARARQLLEVPLELWEAEFHRALGPGGVPACESSYEENALAGRGPVLAGIAGFYEAFAYRPAQAVSEVPDHISVELGFLAYLAMKIAFAEYESKEEEAGVTRAAYERFLKDHLCYWIEPFHHALAQTGSPCYLLGAEWLWEQTAREAPPSSASAGPLGEQGGCLQS
jgi:TorA maturation chaperone TorD